MIRVGRPVAVAVVAMTLMSATAWGEDLSTAPRTQDPVEDVMGRYHLHAAFGKLGRGVSNVFLGWTEIPLNVEKWYSAHDTGGSFFNGLAHGIFRGFARTGIGFYETLTFFLPYPEHYAPILPPLDYFRRTGKRKPLPLE